MTGEDPTTTCDDRECAAPTLAHRIALEIELRAAEAINATPRELLDGWQPLCGDDIESLEDGSAMLPLPDDFLMLLRLRLAGWERDVTDVNLPGSLAAKLQAGGCAALRGSRSRPVATMTACASGRALRLYGRHTPPPKIEEAWYLPAPRFSDDGCINIPEASIPILMKLVADRLQ